MALAELAVGVAKLDIAYLRVSAKKAAPFGCEHPSRALRGCGSAGICESVRRGAGDCAFGV